MIVRYSTLIICICITSLSNAQWISTFAGNGMSGYVDGNAESAEFACPNQIAIDEDDNIYVADFANNVIRLISQDGQVSTFAGSGQQGSADGPKETAQFYNPQGICYDKVTKALYISETGNDLIRKIDQDGIVTTISGDYFGFADGPLESALFYSPNYICSDYLGNLYIADNGNDRVRKIDFSTGLVSTIGGDGIAGYIDGEASTSRFNWPRGITVDKNLNVYVGDQENHVIRKISPDGIVSTVAGSGEPGFMDGNASEARFNGPKGVQLDSIGNLYVSDRINCIIRKIDTLGNVTTVAGIPVVPGYQDGNSMEALIERPVYATPYGQNKLLVSDWGNDNIRLVDFETNSITPLAINTNDIHIYPLPCKDEITVNSELDFNKYVLYSSNLMILQSKILFDSRNLSIDLKAYPSGVYYLKLFTESQTITKKITKI